MAKGEQAGTVSLDMTTAITMEPMPDNTKVLCAVSKMDLGQGPKGRKVHVEVVVMKPAEAGFLNRKLFDDINLENEYTKGRLLNLLKGLGMTEEEIRKPDFKLEPENLLGLQCTIWVGIRKSEQYGDRNSIKRVRTAEAYSEEAEGGEVKY